MLPSPYFLITATLPQELRSLTRSHQKKVYGILFQTAAAAIQKLAHDPTYLGATPAILAVLHTWSRAMAYHPHVHFLVSAGGLDENGHWILPKHSHYLMPARPLGLIFRAKFCDALRKQGLLDEVPPKVWKKNWVLHCQHAGSGETVVSYLARYIHRIAISNSRIDTIDNGQVTFHYRDSKTQNLKRITLSGHDFLSRFLQHVLPRGFTKVRYYGLWSPSSAAKLEEARAQISVPPRPIKTSESDCENSIHASPSPGARIPDHLCPFCHRGPILLRRVLPRRARSP